MATQSYRERMAAARAAASAQRKAEQAEWRATDRATLRSPQAGAGAVKAGIQAKGEKATSSTRAELTMMANALIAPWFIEQVEAKIASRTGHSLSSICDHCSAAGRGFSMTTHPALAAKATVMRPVRRPNTEYRVREHLTEAEVAKLLAALRANRHGPRDWLIGLMIYRHGLRVSEACDLRWDDIDLAARTIVIRRLKGSRDRTHYLERDELAGLRRLARQSRVCLRQRARRPFQADGHRPADRTGWRSRRTAVPSSCAHAAPFLRLRPGEQGDGYAKASALPGPREYHEHGEIFGDEPRAVSGYLAVARGFKCDF